MSNEGNAAVGIDETPGDNVKIPGPNKPKRKPTKKAPGKTKGKAKVKPKVKAGARAPRTRDPAKQDAFGFRKGSIKSNAAVLYLKGATLNDVRDAVGSVQFNVLTEIKALGHTIKEKTLKLGNGREITQYKIIRNKGA